MALIKNKNMTDLAFYRWINCHPLSGHPADQRRFLGFILTARFYASNKYNTYDKFKSECLSYPNNLEQKDIKALWQRKQEVEDFLDELEHADMPLQIEHDDSGSCSTCIQRNIISHKIFNTIITREEFLKGGITEAEVKRRNHAND